MKRTIALLLIITIVISLQGCFLADISQAVEHRHRAIDNTPLKQLGTTWRSEDGKIQFTVVEGMETVNADGITIINGNRGVGTMETNGETVDIVFTTHVSGSVCINDSYNEVVLEEGIGEFEKDNQLTVSFYLKTTYLEKGAIITFYRVEG